MAAKTTKTLSLDLSDEQLAKVKEDSVMTLHAYKVGGTWYAVLHSSGVAGGQSVTVRDIQGVARSLKLVQRKLQATVRRNLVLSGMKAQQQVESTSKAEPAKA